MNREQVNEMAKGKETDYFRTFCTISRAFGGTFDRSALLELIVASAVDAMDAKAACLFLADRHEGVFYPVAQKGLSQNYLHADPLQARTIARTVIQNGYLFIPDATRDPRVENHAMKRAEGIVSILDVPVVVMGKVIGILALYTDAPREFGSDEIDFLTALAEQGGIAIQHARALERMRKNALLFLDLANLINSSLDIRQILHSMTAEICLALNMKGVIIRLLNDDTGTLDLVASYGLSETFLAKGPVRHEKSVVQALRGETVIIENVAHDDRLQYRDAFVQEGIVSVLVVPIKVRDNVIGVMRICSGVERSYPEDLIFLVNALAQTGGLAIQNASMYLALEKDIKDMKEDEMRHRSWF